LPLLIVSALIPGLAAFLVSNTLPKVYEADATLIVGQSLSAVNTDYDQLLVSQQLSSTYASLATTRPILDKVISDLKLDVSDTDLAKRVHADAPAGSTLLTIAAQDANPTLAANIANSISTQLIASSPGLESQQTQLRASINSELIATQAEIDSTQAKIEALNAVSDRTAAQNSELSALQSTTVSLRTTYATLLAFSSSNASNLLSVVEMASPPLSPASPKPLLNALIAAVLGLMVAGAVMIISVYLDDAVKDPDQVQAVAGLGTLGTIPRIKGDKNHGEMYRLATLLYPRSSMAEAYRTLRTNIEFASVGSPIQTLLITSSIPGEGKTITAANLAVAIAQSGKRVLLVDADLRKPGVHQVFNISNVQGLTTMLRTDDVSLDAVARVTDQDNLRVLTTGPQPPNPAELLGSPRMQVVLERLKAGGDLIIFDSPPLQAATDGTILSSFLDGTVLVIDAGASKQRAVRLAREALARAGANVLGAVLNRIPARSQAELGYYGTYAGPEAATSRPLDRDKRTERSVS
jgi:capsular exopolysaccharide synthesis family protein